ncbi:MAG: HepT-like ribonuclease domain-containing protein [Armatimonadota bacterium]
MKNDQLQQTSPQQPTELSDFLPRLKAFFSVMPEVRLAYYQPMPADEQLHLSGPDAPRVIPVFTRSVSSEHRKKRLTKMRHHFTPLLALPMEFVDIEQLGSREACEIAFNAEVIYGGADIAERDRLYRYNLFLEWNSEKKYTGSRQDQPPALLPPVQHPQPVMGVQHFITPIYRHLKMIEGHLREMRRVSTIDLNEFTTDSTLKPLAESVVLKGIQSAVLITISIMHRRMRLSARDFRDLFLLLPVLGMANRELAVRLAKCADVRDRLIFQYGEVSAVEVYQLLFEVADTLHEFKVFMLNWLFEHYYGPTGELLQLE